MGSLPLKEVSFWYIMTDIYSSVYAYVFSLHVNKGFHEHSYTNQYISWFKQSYVVIQK